MFYIDPEIRLKSLLKPGSVFLFVNEDFKAPSPDPHFHVVVNFNPLTEEVVLLVCATSQRDKRKAFVAGRGIPEETLVEVTPDDYDRLSTDTIFDCNTVYTRTLSELTEMYVSGELSIKPNLDENLLTKFGKEST